MSPKEAEKAIRAILASVPTKKLPKFRIEEERDGGRIAWHGSSGYHMRSTRRSTPGEDERECPDVHRWMRMRDLFVAESLARIEEAEMAAEAEAAS